jgi:hypothetical protein
VAGDTTYELLYCGGPMSGVMRGGGGLGGGGGGGGVSRAVTCLAEMS